MFLNIEMRLNNFVTLIKKISVRNRIIFLSSLILLASLILVSLLSYFFIQKGFSDSYKMFFINETDIIQKILTTPEIDTKNALKQETVLEPESNHHYFVKLFDQENTIITQTPGFNGLLKKYNNHILKHKPQSNYVFLKYKKNHYVIYKTGITANNQPYKMIIALNITRDHKILDQFQNIMMIASIVFLLVFLTLETFIIRFGLNPLRNFINKIKDVTPNTLAPLDLKNLPSDLDILLTEINHLIYRVKLSHDKISAFSSNIAHELRTPINNLMLSSETILMKSLDVDDIKNRMLSNIEEYQRLSNLIDKLLFIARLGEKDKGLKLELLDIKPEIDKVIEFHEAIAEEKEVIISLEKCDGSIYADKALFHNAIANIISNAIKYGPVHNKILITSEIMPDGVTIAIADSGPGIPDNELIKITKRFYRFEHNTNDIKPGFGLGLSIVQSIMNALNGTFSIEKNSPSGLIVYLTFSTRKV